MPTSLVCKLAWRCCLSVLLVGLVGCATGPASSTRQVVADQLSSEHQMCRAYRSAWVTYFKANVQAMSDNTQISPAFAETLDEVRQQMAAVGVADQECSKPYCIIQPRQGGKLDSYCGYRVAAETGDELYRWVQWAGQ